MADPTTNTYGPIWEALKQKGSFQIVAHRSAHRRIIKAVVKRKWMDHVFKFDIEPKVGVLRTSISGSIITFTLEIIEDRRVKTLVRNL